MIETIETPSPRVVGLRLSGKLHGEDFKQIAPKMETLCAAKEPVRLFVHFDDFHGWDLRGALADLRFNLKHSSDFERIALVGEHRWEEWLAGIFKPLAKAEVKYFRAANVDDAWNWLEEEVGKKEEMGKEVAAEVAQLGDVTDDLDAWPEYY